MKINSAVLIPTAAVVSSVLLLLAGKKRVFEIIALVASAVWLVVAIGVMTWPLKQVNMDFAIGGTLLVAGVVVYLNTGNKREVTASTVISILGGILVVQALSRHF